MLPLIPCKNASRKQFCFLLKKTVFFIAYKGIVSVAIQLIFRRCKNVNSCLKRQQWTPLLKYIFLK